MIMNSNLILKHSIWEKMQELYPVQGGQKPRIALFPRLIDLYIFACTIGMHDGIRTPNDLNDEIASINSKTYNDPSNDDLKRTLDFLLKILVLTMDVPELKNCTRSEKEQLAFSADKTIDKFNAASILSEYANYGATKIYEIITNSDTESISNISDYVRELKDANIELPDIDYFDKI